MSPDLWKNSINFLAARRKGASGGRNECFDELKSRVGEERGGGGGGGGRSGVCVLFICLFNCCFLIYRPVWCVEFV